jgi:hypothetical protein
MCSLSVLVVLVAIVTHQRQQTLAAVALVDLLRTQIYFLLLIVTQLLSALVVLFALRVAVVTVLWVQ